MKLTVVGTGSKGNCYLLRNEAEALIIECGMRFKEVKKVLDYDLNTVVGCILSHAHGDHAKYAKEVVEAGIDLYCLPETSNTFNFKSHRIHKLFVKKKFTLGNFEILPFEVKHDVPTVGFLIKHPENGITAFLTDTYYCEFLLPPVNNLLIEANYCEEIINNKVNNGVSEHYLRDRIYNSHMSIATCKEFLSVQDISKLSNIVLIHLSDSNSDEKRFQQEVYDMTLKNVVVAKKGLEIELNKMF